VLRETTRGCASASLREMFVCQREDILGGGDPIGRDVHIVWTAGVEECKCDRDARGPRATRRA
jgi:hypothetical protein